MCSYVLAYLFRRQPQRILCNKFYFWCFTSFSFFAEMFQIVKKFFMLHSLHLFIRLASYFEMISPLGSLNKTSNLRNFDLFNLSFLMWCTLEWLDNLTDSVKIWKTNIPWPKTDLWKYIFKRLKNETSKFGWNLASQPHVIFWKISFQ